MSISRWVVVGYVDEFSPSFRVIVVDPLGHGASEKPHNPEAYTLPGFAEDIIAVLDAESIERACFWGYSMGGAIAYVLATQFPERVSALVVGGSSPAPLSPDLAESRRKTGEMLRRGDWDAYFESMGLRGTRTAEALREGNDPRALADVQEGLALPNPVVNDLTRIKGGALVYAGTADQSLGLPANLDRLKAVCRQQNARLQLLDGLTHPQAFGAKDAVSAFVKEFLRTTAS